MPDTIHTLRTALVDWTDFDVAAHSLAQTVGIFPFDMPMRQVKHVSWSNMPLGNCLIEQLELLDEFKVRRTASVYISYLAVGGIFSLAGLLVLRKRYSSD